MHTTFMPDISCVYLYVRNLSPVKKLEELADNDEH